ncbi:hypothetical protein [Paraburkholderia bannensis]|uniref:hypothetical protein n=1 Tax=Paraburkholderia bannensis TaxID=765414 RepID=UPI002AB14831|nr:hypothetical protein [Paraburkholderia bannensis]
MEHDSYPTRIDSADCTADTSKRTKRRPSALRHALMGAALLVGALPALALAAAPAASCDAWIGDYAPQPSAKAVVRIERGETGFVARQRDAEGNWDAETIPLTDVTHTPDLDLKMRHGCLLAGEGALLIRAPKGSAYQATSATGQNFSTYHMATDSLMIFTQGFQVDGHDLYPVAAVGASPPPPAPLRKAVEGKEASSFTCPGQSSPDITQAAFDALPADYRKRFQAVGAQAQASVICGQRLGDLLTLDTYLSVDLQANRASTLAEAKALLAAGEVPRDDAGAQIWWRAAYSWLARNVPLFADGKPVPLQAEYFTAFDDDILPRLPNAPSDDTQSVSGVVQSTLSMPEPQALKTLARLKTLGALDVRMIDTNIAGYTLPRALDPGVSDAVFETLWRIAGAPPRDTSGWFIGAIDSKNTTGVERLLRHNLDPRDARVLLRARTQPQLYATLLNAAFERARSEGGKLAPTVVDPLIQGELWAGKTIDWARVDKLVAHGGDLSRSFVTGVHDDRESLAYFARSAPTKFLELLDHGLRVDQIYPVGKDALLTRYLTMRISWLPEGPRPDVVEAMLKRYNNAATGKPCDDCTYSPFAVALGNKGPNSVPVLKVLMRYGANPNARDPQGFPVVSYAVMDNRVDILDAMASTPVALDLKVTDPNGFSLLAIARCFDATQAVTWLRKHGADQPDQGYAACRKGLAERQKSASAAR